MLAKWKCRFEDMRSYKGKENHSQQIKLNFNISLWDKKMDRDSLSNLNSHCGFGYFQIFAIIVYIITKYFTCFSAPSNNQDY